MALWNVYLDESGSHAKAGVFAVGGYLMRSDTAKIADAAWKAILDNYGIDHFHMVDCAPTPASGQFARLGVNDRSALVRKLIELIKEYAAFGVCTLMNPARWKPTKNSHAIATVNTVEHLALLVGKVDPSAEIAIFIEAGHESSGLTLDALTSRHSYELYNGVSCKPSVTFHYKGENRLLEAADLLCWQTTKFIKDKISQARKPRQDFLSLMEAPHGFWLMNNDLEGGRAINWFRWRNPPRASPNLETYIGGMFKMGEDADKLMAYVHGLSDAKSPPKPIGFV